MLTKKDTIKIKKIFECLLNKMFNEMNIECCYYDMGGQNFSDNGDSYYIEPEKMSHLIIRLKKDVLNNATIRYQKEDFYRVIKYQDYYKISKAFDARLREFLQLSKDQGLIKIVEGVIK